MMLIDNRILVVHMPKCGGTSFCLGLIDLLPPERLFYLGYTPEGEALSAQWRRKPHRVWKHATARVILRGMKLRRADLEIHLLSLRPWWERVASYYFHARRYHALDRRKYPWAGTMTFSDYLRSPHMDIARIDDYACDSDGTVLVDHFIPFADLDGAYARFCDRLGFPGQRVPHANQNPLKAEETGGADLRALYAPDDWDHLAARFAPETAFLACRGLVP